MTRLWHWICSIGDASHWRILYAHEIERRLAAEHESSRRMTVLLEMRAELESVRLDLRNALRVAGYVSRRASLGMN